MNINQGRERFINMEDKMKNPFWVRPHMVEWFLKLSTYKYAWEKKYVYTQVCILGKIFLKKKNDCFRLFEKIYIICTYDLFDLRIYVHAFKKIICSKIKKFYWKPFWVNFGK